jgi:hypothetical protein
MTNLLVFKRDRSHGKAIGAVEATSFWKPAPAGKLRLLGGVFSVTGPHSSVSVNLQI